MEVQASPTVCSFYYTDTIEDFPAMKNFFHWPKVKEFYVNAATSQSII